MRAKKKNKFLSRTLRLEWMWFGFNSFPVSSRHESDSRARNATRLTHWTTTRTKKETNPQRGQRPDAAWEARTPTLPLHAPGPAVASVPSTPATQRSPEAPIMSTGPIAAHQNPVEGAERPYFGRFRTRTASVCVCVWTNGIPYWTYSPIVRAPVAHSFPRQPSLAKTTYFLHHFLYIHVNITKTICRNKILHTCAYKDVKSG